MRLGGVLIRKLPTVYDVAQHAGVSIATVSRVLRGPQSVRETTRERVLKSVRELGYVPSASARGLAGRRTKVLGLLFPGDTQRQFAQTAVDLATHSVVFIDDRSSGIPATDDHLYFDEILRGAEYAAWQAGYALMVASGRGLSGDIALDNVSGRVDALAVLAKTLDDATIEEATLRVPVAVLAGSAPANADEVSVDNRGGMRALTQHVLATKPPGPLLYLDGPSTSPDAEARREGFRDASAGTDVTFLETDFTEPAGFARTAEFISHTVPGAVVAANDQSALGALAALHRAEIGVPDRCVVTGFDGIDAGRYSTPPITTVQQPMMDLGRAAIELILRRLEQPDVRPTSRKLPVQILLRESCPPGL